jgi:transmembrane sensor
VHSGNATVRAVGTQFDVYRKDSGTTVTVLEGRVAVYSTVRRGAPADETASSSQRRNSAANSASQNTRQRVSPTHSPFTSALASRATTPIPPPPGLTEPSGSSAVFVSAGEQVTITPDSIASPHHTDATAATAWMQRRLVFEGSKLSDVVDEFNRYNHTQLVIDDPRLRDFEISGVYSSTDPASLLRFLRDQGVKVIDGDDEVRIEAR